MIRERTRVQQYFLWSEIEKAIGKEFGNEDLANCHLIDWHDDQDDYVNTGEIGKKAHNAVFQLAGLEKKYAKALKSGQYKAIPYEVDIPYEGLTIPQMDDHSRLLLLRALVKILGESYAKSFHILYDFEE